MRETALCILACLGLWVSHIFSPQIVHSAVITVINLDGAGEGFNDPSAPNPASNAGGNDGATLGAQRLIAFQYGANIWANRLSSPVEIRIDANLDPLACTSTSATLGAAGTTTAHRNFNGAPLANTWYPQALANSRAGTDLSPGMSDIRARFNSSIGTTCPFPLVWYYGLDGNPPSGTLDFVSVVLHELTHGLGFQSFVNLATGAKLGGFDDIFSRSLEDHATGKLYPQMTNTERIAASQNTENLHWIGANVVAASGTLSAGVHPTGHVQMYAPNPQEPGSSVSHFDTAVTPNEMMEPFYTGPNHGVWLTSKLFLDLGWALAPPISTADFDGDGTSDIAIYRDGIWFIKRSSDGGTTSASWGGLAQDLPEPADYDGDGKVDIAVYRDGIWFVIRSSDGAGTSVGWGGLPQDIPVPADYDGDGKADVAVYRDGIWFAIHSSDGGQSFTGWGGAPQDLPVPADYDGDGKIDLAVYRSGTWLIRRSSDGGTTVVGWGGLAQDITVPADYDGDGKADIAVYRDGIWYIIQSSTGTKRYVAWGGLAQDIPVPADYDGDGKTDVAIYRNGIWYIIRSSDGLGTSVGWGGLAQDIPLN